MFHNVAGLRSCITHPSWRFRTIQPITHSQAYARHTLRPSAPHYTTSAPLSLLPHQFSASLNSRHHILFRRRHRRFRSIVSTNCRNYATEIQRNEPGTTRTHALLIHSPDPSNPDVDQELLTDGEAHLQITERAGEQLRSITTKENDATLALRIAIESGGCHGYQYKMELTSERTSEDYIFTHPKYFNDTYFSAVIVVDQVSLALLKGSTLDYATELIGSSFRIVDNPQSKGSGCGCGISWEAKF